MKLYLVNAENIYFQQIKGYFREIISSYDNGNYRSAMVMLYSTIVCDLLLKLKELSDVYADEKAEKILEDINKQRKNANSSAWEWNLIKKIREQTEILSDESYAMIEHIYSLRNFSAHPALNEDYELISPTAEMTVAYIKKALEDILIKPSVFAQNIVDRMSNDISDRKEFFVGDYAAFKSFLNRVYLQRMSEKMITQVFKAFWKFTFIKIDKDIFNENRLINRKTLEVLLEEFYDIICKFIGDNQNYFSVSTNDACLKHICIMLSKFPKVYNQLEQTIQYQISKFDAGDFEILKWFVAGDLEQHIATYRSSKDLIPFKLLDSVKEICEKQGAPRQFTRLLIKHYKRSRSYTSARTRFDECISHYLSDFNSADFIELIEVINGNRQIYGYGWQKERNDKILEYARPLLPDNFNFEDYPNFEYTKESDKMQENEIEETDSDINNDVDDSDLPF